MIFPDVRLAGVLDGIDLAWEVNQHQVEKAIKEGVV
jgi:hypothetical protein